MPSNVFIYQLPIKTAPVNDSDLLIVEDMGTKQIPASALRHYFYDYVVPSLSATEFVASSARFSVVDITSYELSGFKSTGDLTVEGNLSATKVIYTSNYGNSIEWDSVHSSVNTTSGNWNSVYSNVNNTSGSWNSVYTTVNSSSADNTLTTTLCAISGNGVPFIMSFTRGLLTGVTWN